MSIQTEELDALMYIVDRPEIVFVEGQGSWISDHTGKKYLDFIQGWAVNCLGHSPKVLVDAINEQAGRLFSPSPAFYNAPMLKLAKQLAEHSCFDRTFFANSGAEANEGALKLARKWGQKNRNGAYEIITMEHGFHGRTLAMMSASGKPQWEPLYEPKVPGFPKAPLNDLDAVVKLINDKTVGIMLEPIQGEAGVYVAEDGYMRELRALADEHNLLLIVDEVQTGMGRTGKLFGYEHSGVEPDIMTLGKGIGGGIPLAALMAKESACCFEPGDQGGTYNGNPIMTAVGSAVLETMTAPDFLEEVTATGNYMREKLGTLSQAHGFGEVRGRGMLQALNLKQEIAGDISAKAMEQGLLLNAPRPDTLRFMPALNTSREEVDQMIDILTGVINSLN
ncbi:MAG: acetylornithine transaminase [Pseudomonadota bacterium]